MSNNSLSIATALTLLIAAACSSIETTDPYDYNSVSRVSMEMAGFTPEDGTKLNVTILDGNRYSYWEDTDEVGIFPDKGGYQLGFSLNGQGGKTTATFDGGGWALRTDAKYAAYFPFEFDNKDRKVIPVNYLGQTQNGENNLSHLGDYTFCASDPSSAVNGTVSFLLNQVGTMVWFKLTLPDIATYSEISLVTDDNLFVVSGTYSLEEGSGLAITPSSKAKAVKLALKGVTTTAKNQLVNAFMMVAPTDLTGHSYKLYVKTSEGIYYSSDLKDKNHVFGKGSAKAVTASPTLSEGYNLGIGDWGDGGSISGGAE